MTWEELLALWSERDARYARRRGFGALRAMALDTAAAVREYRRTEINLLPLSGREAARLELGNWRPPVAT